MSLTTGGMEGFILYMEEIVSAHLHIYVGCKCRVAMLKVFILLFCLIHKNIHLFLEGSVDFQLIS